MKKGKMAIGFLGLAALLAGCFYSPGEQKKAVNEEPLIEEKIEKACRDIYEYYEESRGMESFERIGETVKKLGEEGWPVVDQGNQFNMENPAPVKAFCEKVEKKKDGGLDMIIALNNGGFVRFSFVTTEGRVEVTADSLAWEDGSLNVMYTEAFPAYEWVYPENGYLFFGKQYMAGFSGPYSHVAVRVEPLDAVCRELNRTYILPWGYGSNNVFITDWSEHDYRALDFYDIFEKRYNRYPLDISGMLTAEAEDGSAVYQIPERDFEQVVTEYFPVDSQELKADTDYVQASSAYEFRPRSLYDSGPGAEAPYPEVVAYEMREDGTIEMTVNAVWPEQNQGAALSHRTVVRPLSNGSFQYIENQVISSEYHAAEWYKPRPAKGE